ncbi:hypothetical protein GJ496_004421 [Pomphorhynchus laevis]|nr:hypothetical protein GJ496_004421 [Pomphorhynchus laevis]
MRKSEHGFSHGCHRQDFSSSNTKDPTTNNPLTKNFKTETYFPSINTINFTDGKVTKQIPSDSTDQHITSISRDSIILPSYGIVHNAKPITKTSYPDPKVRLRNSIKESLVEIRNEDIKNNNSKSASEICHRLNYSSGN